MKKILALLLFSVIPVVVNAQFVLTKKGYVNKNDDSKDYVVIEKPGYTQQQLYSMVKTMVTANYVSPKTVLSENEPISLCVTGEETIPFSLITNHLLYNVVFHFRDGKIKFQPHFVSIEAQLFFTFNDNPRPVMKNTIAQCERVINDIYSKTTKIQVSNDDDW